MPDYVATRIAESLNDAGKPVRGSRILGVGVAFKPGVDDLRGSPAVEVLERLIAKGADVDYHDPYVPTVSIGGRSLRSVSPDAAGGYDLVTILTAHPQVDVHALVHASRLVFDARGATVGIAAPHVVRL
jgi:UDP-N-acetyl-D-glucosamine dehydrogenase